MHSRLRYWVRVCAYNDDVDSSGVIGLILISTYDSSDGFAKPIVLIPLNIIEITVEGSRSVGTSLSERHGRFRWQFKASELPYTIQQ